VGRDDEGKGGPPFAKRKGAKGCTPIPLTRLTEKKTKRLAEEAVTSELPLHPGKQGKIQGKLRPHQQFRREWVLPGVFDGLSQIGYPTEQGITGKMRPAKKRVTADARR
jgi:hypothetical protein